jgi:fatty-acyl-CoA synthase
MATVPLVDATIGDLMSRNAQMRPDDTAFFCGDVRYTWKVCDEVSNLMASRLLQRGITKGTHLGFWSLNDISEVLELIAAMKIGAIPAVINYSYRALELEHVIDRAKIEALMIGVEKQGADYWRTADRTLEVCPTLKSLYSISTDFCAAMEAYRGGCELPPVDALHLESAKGQVHAHDVACLTFTSGTTKDPKPVMLSYYNIVNDVMQFDARMEVTSKDAIFADLPLFHCSGMTGLLFHAVVSGASAVVNPMFHAEEALRNIENYHLTVMMVVPSMIELMLLCPDFKQFDLSSLRVGMISGAPVSPAKMHEYIEELGLSYALNSYGQTECSPIVTTTLKTDDIDTLCGTIGKPLDHLEVRIADSMTDEELPCGTSGEIQVRGFNTMIGYFNFGDENKKKFTKDGWLKTTDAGYYDERGYLHFDRRISSTIIRHGENISPTEIEAVIEGWSRDIAEVVVCGVPDKRAGEEIACVVQTKSGKLDADALRAYVKKTLASFKCPRYVFLVKDMPKTATGKVSLKDTHDLAVKLVEEERNGASAVRPS